MKETAMFRSQIAVLALLALPVPAMAERLLCAPDFATYCGNLHVTCVGRSSLPAPTLRIEGSGDTLRVNSGNGPEEMNVSEDRGFRILRGKSPGYIRLGTDGRFSQRIYVGARALMSIGTCFTQDEGS